jgi:hypothetical protein
MGLDLCSLGFIDIGWGALIESKDLLTQNGGVFDEP